MSATLTVQHAAVCVCDHTYRYHIGEYGHPCGKRRCKCTGFSRRHPARPPTRGRKPLDRFLQNVALAIFVLLAASGVLPALLAVVFP